MKLDRFWTFCIAAALSTAVSFAVTPTIGVASAVGSFTVDSAIVDGNANLFEGSQIKTVDASSRIFLQTGASLTLGTNSAGIVYKDHMVLEQGAAKLAAMNGYSVDAANYRIEGAQPVSQAVVRLLEGTVEVAAVGGSLKVFDRKGLLLTRIGAGSASAFQSGTTGQSGATTGQSGATAGQSGATTGQSGATAGQTGATTGANQTKKEVVRYSVLGGMLAGLGFGVDAILQPTSP